MAIESVQQSVGEITEATAEIVARIGGERAGKGITLPLADLLIGASALELGRSHYQQSWGLGRIPGLRVEQV